MMNIHIEFLESQEWYIIMMSTSISKRKQKNFLLLYQICLSPLNARTENPLDYFSLFIKITLDVPPTQQKCQTIYHLMAERIEFPLSHPSLCTFHKSDEFLSSIFQQLSTLFAIELETQKMETIGKIRHPWLIYEEFCVLSVKFIRKDIQFLGVLVALMSI